MEYCTSRCAITSILFLSFYIVFGCVRQDIGRVDIWAGNIGKESQKLSTFLNLSRIYRSRTLKFASNSHFWRESVGTYESNQTLKKPEKTSHLTKPLWLQIMRCALLFVVVSVNVFNSVVIATNSEDSNLKNALNSIENRQRQLIKNNYGVPKQDTARASPIDDENLMYLESKPPDYG